MKFKRFSQGIPAITPPPTTPPPTTPGNSQPRQPDITPDIDPDDTPGGNSRRSPIKMDPSGFILNPYDRVKELIDYENQEQMRDISTSATGMAESTRKKLIEQFVEADAGITPEIDEAITRLTNTFIVDWGDKANEKAIFGTMDTLLKNMGPLGAQQGMNLLSSIYEQLQDNPNFDPTEMLQILNEWTDPTKPPEEKAKRAMSFISSAVIDPNDILGSLGIGKTGGKAASAEGIKKDFLTLLQALAKRPTTEQLTANEMAQLYNAHRQSLFGAGKDWSKNLMLPVGRALGDMTAVAEWFPGSLAQKAFQPGINDAAQTLTGVGTFPSPYMGMGGMGAPFAPQTNVNPNALGGSSLSRRNIQQPFEATQRAASKNGKFRKLTAQALDVPAEQVAANMDESSRQLAVLQREFGGEYKQIMKRLSPMLVQQEDMIEAQISQYELFKKQWEDDIRSGVGLADPAFADAMLELSVKMANSYDSLLSVYVQMYETTKKSMEFFADNGDDSANGFGMKLNTALKQLSVKITDTEQKVEKWKMQAADEFKMKAQLLQVTKVNPLQKGSEALISATGGDFGGGAALGAAQLQVAKQLSDAERYLEQFGEQSAAKRGHLRTQRLEADKAAIDALTKGPAETGSSAANPSITGL